MKICFVTGGTGGHIYPALALADKMKELDSSTEILFIGNDDRMEKDLIPQNGYAFKALHTSGLVGNALKKCMAVCQMFKAEGKAKKYLKEFNPDVVIGFGGYVSAPVIMAAHSLGIHTVIHEQNSIVGKANQLVMKKVDAIVTCYEKCNEVFPKDKIHMLGNPRATIAKEATFDEDYLNKVDLSVSPYNTAVGNKRNAIELHIKDKKTNNKVSYYRTNEGFAYQLFCEIGHKKYLYFSHFYTRRGYYDNRGEIIEVRYYGPHLKYKKDLLYNVTKDTIGSIYGEKVKANQKQRDYIYNELTNAIKLASLVTIKNMKNDYIRKLKI